MKKLYISALAALLLGATACNDVLDVQPTSQYGDDAIWKNETTADFYIMASYNFFEDYSNFMNLESHYYDACSDLFKSTIWDAGNEVYNKAYILGDRFLKNSASMFDCWSTAYNRIKRANVLLNSLEKYAPAFNDPEWMTVREAEIRFCRAMNYFHIARIYGGAVIRTDKSGLNGATDDGAVEEDCNRARATEEDTYKFILDELQWAADNLPDEWKGETKEGRATKGMVYGFISRVALYAQQWEIAAQAARKCEVLGKYSLVKDFASLFNNANDKANRQEILYAMYFKKDLKKHSYDATMRSPGDADARGTTPGARIVPTAELADSYEFCDGTAFDWKTYTKVTDASGKKLTDPYTYREPRFHATILYNGAKWEGREIATYIGQTSAVPDGVDKFVEWEAASWPKGNTSTGYYTRKYLIEGNTEYPDKGSYNTEIIMRFAEVLLNEAEAIANMPGGTISDALIPLNRVRARVGLPAKTTTDAPNLDAFMKILRKERICELAGEGLRYFDLLRWGLAQEVIDGQAFHGVQIQKRTTGTLQYKTVECDGGRTRMFPNRFYRLSLPAAELTNNKLCLDNPDW